jgi:hypothetical protein
MIGIVADAEGLARHLHKMHGVWVSPGRLFNAVNDAWTESVLAVPESGLPGGWVHAEIGKLVNAEKWGRNHWRGFRSPLRDGSPFCKLSAELLEALRRTGLLKFAVASNDEAAQNWPITTYPWRWLDRARKEPEAS